MLEKLFIIYYRSLNIILQDNNTLQNLNKNEWNLVEKIINVLKSIK